MNGRDKSKGSLCDPNRHKIHWQDVSYYDDEALQRELERVFDICLGCRRCVNLCQAFPTLFDMVDESEEGELDPEQHRVHYPKVVEQCYLCDRCYMNKCPYTPPHPWEVDFPHLMLQAKAQYFKQGQTKVRDRLISSTEAVGKLATIPVVVQGVNGLNRQKTSRRLMEATLGIDKEAPLPSFHRPTARKKAKQQQKHLPPVQATSDKDKVVLFTTCYGNYNMPQLCDDLIAVFEHNEIDVVVPEKQWCCGMPKLELGDMDSINRYKEKNIPLLLSYVQQGYDIIAPIPSCVLMFKQELPLMYYEDEAVLAVRNAFFDPFEYLLQKHKQGTLKLDFKNALGDISYHVACHLEVQNMGFKTEALLKLIPGTQVKTLQRCSGHDGTYGVKKEYHANAVNIGKPVMKWINKDSAPIFSSDCPMATSHLEAGPDVNKPGVHPLSLLRKAYGI